MAPHFSNSCGNDALGSLGAPRSAPRCRFSPNTSVSSENQDKLFTVEAHDAPHSCPVRASRRGDQKVKWVLTEGEENPTACHFVPDVRVVRQHPGRVLRAVWLAEKARSAWAFWQCSKKTHNNWAFPLYSFSENGGVGLCSGRRHLRFQSEALGRALLAGWGHWAQPAGSPTRWRLKTKER